MGCILSVIIPVYNTAPFLQACIDSVLSQNFESFELLLVDDGSTDGSETICDQNAEKDSRVRVIHQSNRGVSVARNTGLVSSTGEWVCFVDSDDFLDAGYFDVTLDDRIDLYVRNWCFVGCDFTDYCPPVTVESEQYWSYLRENAHRDRFRTVAGLFMKRRLINSIRFDGRFSLGEDTLFIMDYLAKCHSLQVLDGAVYRYRRCVNWENKRKLQWEETQDYLNAFWARYSVFPAAIPKLPDFIFSFFYYITDKESMMGKWGRSIPVLKYKRTLLPSKGFRFRLKYLISRFLSFFINV